MSLPSVAEVTVAFERFRSRRSSGPPFSEEADDAPVTRAPVWAIPIDTFADASLAREREKIDEGELRCDACDRLIEGEAAGHGLFLTARGDEVRFDEPPLCLSCATAIGIHVLADAEIEEEG